MSNVQEQQAHPLDKPAQAVLTLDPDVTAPGQARSFVTRCCQELEPDAGAVITDVAVLLTSEAVTNAFLHGRSEIRLAVSVTPAAVRVMVSDDNSRHPVIADRDDEALDGRGMAMIAGLATAWGVEDDDIGKTVWFEVLTPDS